MNKLVILCACLLLSTAFSKDWYISKQRGDDDNEGSLEHPFSTIKRAYLKATNGDSLNIEPGVYSEENTMSKSLRIRGHGGRPLISGHFYFKDTSAVEVSDLNMETNTRHMISVSKLQNFKIFNVNLGPKYMRQGHGINIENTQSADISNVKIFESDVGIKISSSLFHIRNAEVTKCKLGMVLWLRSKGTVDNSTISNSDGNYNIDGAGLHSNGDITLRNVNLINNHASVLRKAGGGFFCSGGGLNIFGGKIIGNKALHGAAGECETQCSFFASGVEFKDNEGEHPSKCRGVPASERSK